MTDLKRRRMLAALAAAPAAGASLRAAWAGPRAEGEQGRLAADPLLPDAAAWIGGLRQQGQTLLPYPVSRLQRQFRIGYNRTCALAAALEQQGHWTIAVASNGVRYARITVGGKRPPSSNSQ